MRFLGPSAHLLEALQKPGDRSSESVTALREVVFGNQEVLRQNCLPAVSQHSVLGIELPHKCSRQRASGSGPEFLGEE